jgi:hypothetical protein
MMGNAIFLSASVPDPVRSPKMAATADSVAITAAVSALIHVTLGRRPLVWGGHPAITPMILCAAENLGVNYGKWVRLYQSKHFQDEFPEDNAKFSNVVYTPDMGSREDSLLEMRKKMFASTKFHAAVFIGGMEGVIKEFNLFKKAQPKSKIVPVASTGGAAMAISDIMFNLDSDLSRDLDYVALFHRYLNIDVREKRYPDPGSQPAQPKSRKPGTSGPTP